MEKLLRLAVVVVLVCLAGCASDDGTGPDAIPFALSLTVTDPDGDPVSGLQAKLHVYLPPEIMPYADKASTTIPFTVPDAADVTLVVYDMDGGIVRTLLEGPVPAGWHQVAFHHGDEERPLIGTHLYRCELVAAVADTERYRAETFLTLYTAIDADQRPVLGITDDMGQISFNTRTEFPYLYNPGPQTRTNELGQVQGTFEFPDQVEIRLADLGLGLYLDYPVIVGQGVNQVSLVWDEAMAEKPRDLVLQEPRPGARPDVSAIPPPLPAYSLGPAYPNPFN